MKIILLIGAGLLLAAFLLLLLVRKSKSQANVRRRTQYGKHKNRFSKTLLQGKQCNMDRQSMSDRVQNHAGGVDILGLKAEQDEVRKGTGGQVSMDAHEVFVDQTVPDYIAHYLVAEEGRYFQGYELLQALLSCGLRYGDQHIFHYFCHDDDNKHCLFSCARLQKPGTFNIQDMGSCRCQGLALFYSVSESENPVLAYEELLKTMHNLQSSLDGNILAQDMRKLDNGAVDQLRMAMATVLSRRVRTTPETVVEV